MHQDKQHKLRDGTNIVVSVTNCFQIGEQPVQNMAEPHTNSQRAFVTKPCQNVKHSRTTHHSCWIIVMPHHLPVILVKRPLIYYPLLFLHQSGSIHNNSSKDAKHFVQTCVLVAARTVAVTTVCGGEQKTAIMGKVNKHQKQDPSSSVSRVSNKSGISPPVCQDVSDSGGCRCHMPERPLHFFARPNLLHHHVTQHTCNKANVSLLKNR